MKTRLITLLVSLVLSFAAEVPPLSDDSDELLECKLLGFGEMLSCSTCKKFEDVVADQRKPALLWYSSSPMIPKSLLLP